MIMTMIPGGGAPLRRAGAAAAEVWQAPRGGRATLDDNTILLEGSCAHSGKAETLNFASSTAARAWWLKLQAESAVPGSA